MTETATLPIRILIADDHAIVREGLRALLDTEPGMELVGEAVDGIDAVAKARALAPDVILLDMVMPRQDGLAALTQIKTDDPDARVLILTSFAEDETLFPAIKAGALGYLLKDSPPPQLLQAIRDVHAGQSSLHPTVARRLLQELNAPDSWAANPLKDSADGPDALTEREIDVLRGVARGLSNQEIAAELVISERTARTHVSNILDKLHLDNRTQAALYALRAGIADLDTE